RWCAPELLGGDVVSATRPTYASDVFSFGMVVLEVFSGKAPFHEVSDNEVVKWVRSGERPNRPTGSDKFGLSDTLWEVIERCWHGSPEFRRGMVDVPKHTRRL
ncbi:kinase-like protein, partial [Thelephora ganbajun]